VEGESLGSTCELKGLTLKRNEETESMATLPSVFILTADFVGERFSTTQNPLLPLLRRTISLR